MWVLIDVNDFANASPEEKQKIFEDLSNYLEKNLPLMNIEEDFGLLVANNPGKQEKHKNDCQNTP
jgi:hypothetical protein